MSSRYINIIIFTICLVILNGCDTMRFDNTTNKNRLISERYSFAQIEELKNVAANERISFSEFRKNFQVECARKTHQGHYVILLLEDEENAFVFFNEESVLTHVITTNGFIGKEEFIARVREQKRKSAVLEGDPNAFFYPVSAIECTAHIVQEGVCIVRYTRLMNGVIVKDPIVSSIDFIENGKIPTHKDDFIKDEIPYILDMDKSE